MITRDEALTRTRSWMAKVWPINPPEIGLHEFEHGWVIWPIPPAPQDPPQPPARYLTQWPSISDADPPTTDFPRKVLDHETGEMTRWRSMPAADIAAKYTAMKAAGDRFPPDVRFVLEDSGWFPGRDISAAVDQWEIEFADRVAGMTFFPAARAAMREFGGLSIGRTGGRNPYRSHFFPFLSPRHVFIDRVEYFPEDYHPAFPLGHSEDEGAEIVMDEQGRVFFLHPAGDYYLGPTIDAALVSLIRWNSDWPQAWEYNQPSNAGANE